MYRGSLDAADSCYYCTGTPQCGDPLDYNEVSPRKCLENSVCLKYISSSKNEMGEVVAHDLTYRRCFQPVILSEDICTFVKNAEEEALQQLNHTLISFECDACNVTNCNRAPPNKGSFLSCISLFLIFLYILPLL